MKARPRVTVLYEDQRGSRQGFGLHALVKACVFDIINGDRAWLERDALGDHRPLKGAGNLLRTCREDIDLIAADGRRVFAVFDDDKIRVLLRLPSRASDARVEQEIRKGCRTPDRLVVALLKQNTESVLAAAGECDVSISSERIERALRNKDLLERDAIFFDLARERSRPARDCVLRKVPSLKKLVELLCHDLNPR
ncbi:MULTISPECIES: hypothetical protein [Sorangium]|uniref:hypothetical protein n=1 Tax=Sorangium TaxID=39643 RepID=UPI003D9C0D26